MARLKDKASKLLGRGQYEKAVRAYRKVLDEEPGDMNSRIRLGDAYRRLNKTVPALGCYRQVAEFYARDGQLLKAIAVCKLVLDVEPRHEETQGMLADLYSRRVKEGVSRSSTAMLSGTDKDGPSIELEKCAPPQEEESSIEGASDNWGLFKGEELGPADEIDSTIHEDPDEEAFVLQMDVDYSTKEDKVIDYDGIEEDFSIDLAEPPPPPPALEPKVLPPMPLLSDLERDAFVEFLNKMKLRHVDPGTVMIRQGDEGNSFFIVVSGRLEVMRTIDEETIRMGHLRQGSFFGEMSLLSGRPRLATVTASSETELLEMDGKMLDDLMSCHPSVREALERFHMQRLLMVLLQTSPIFRPFENKDRRGIFKRFRLMKVPADTVLIKEGTFSKALFVVLRGSLEAVRKEAASEVFLGNLREGDVIGEMSLLRSRPAACTVKATSDCSLLCLRRDIFFEFIKANPRVGDVLNTIIEERERKAEQAPALQDPVVSSQPLSDILVVSETGG